MYNEITVEQRLDVTEVTIPPEPSEPLAKDKFQRTILMKLEKRGQGSCALSSSKGRWLRLGDVMRQRRPRKEDTSKGTTTITQGIAEAAISTTSFSVDTANTITDYEEMIDATPFFIVIKF